MFKILKTVAPTAEQLDFVIGNFFKENGMEYTSSMEYAPRIAGYGEFCEKRDLVYHLSEADEKMLRSLISDPDVPLYGSSEITKRLSACALISAPIKWYEQLTFTSGVKSYGTSNRMEIIGCAKSIDTIRKEDCGDEVTIEQVHELRALHDAAINTGSMQIFKDFVTLLPDDFMLTRSFVFTYSRLVSFYDCIAYPGVCAGEEFDRDPKAIMAKWIHDLPCSFLINPRFENNCLVPTSDEAETEIVCRVKEDSVYIKCRP